MKPEPGRDQEMARRTERLNLLFALTSVGLLLTVSLMIWADYDREWKKYQIEFNGYEIKLTEKQVQDALGKVGADRKKALDAQLAQGEKEIAARRDEVRKAQADADRVHAKWYGIDQDYRFTKADIDVKRYDYEEAAYKHESSATKKKADLDALEERWRKLRVELEKVLADEDAAKGRFKELEKTKLDAENKQKEVLGEYNRLQDRLRKIQPGPITFIRNLPVLDLANPSLRINQIMPGNLYDDVIFTPTPKVDRCTTCHLGIDKKGYENDKQPYRTHPDMDTYLRGPHPIEKIGCTACHQGRGRATSFVNSVHTPSSKKQQEEWGQYSHTKEYERWHFWDYPMLAKGHTESQCLKCHQGTVEVPRAASLNLGNLLVERYGCFGCHKIKGWENLRKAGPDLTKILSKTNEEWIYRWVREPRSFRPTRMPQIWGVRTKDKDTPDARARDEAEVNAVVAYVAEKSGRESYPGPPTGDLGAGRKTFESVGCLACHRIGDDRRGIEAIEAAAFRTHGPNLDGTGSKVNAGWLYAWVRNPKGYWHETKMPNLRLTDREAADVTAYLMSLKNEPFAGQPRPAMNTTVRDTIVQDYLLAQYTTKQADDKLEAMDDRQRTLFLGEKTIGRYGCFGCHTISGFEKTSPIGTELTEEGSKLVERLDFGFEGERIAHTLPAWLHEKFIEPRVFDREKAKRPDELLRMGNFHFTSDEADALVTAILSMTKEQVPLAAQRQLSADEKYVEKGRRLVRNLNCQGCHQIGEKGGTIQQVIQSAVQAPCDATPMFGKGSCGLDETDARLRAVPLSPPMLYNEKAKIGEGARVQTPWLHTFLKDPSNHIRPWLQVRMPTFDFTEDEANAIAQYFAAMDKAPFPYEPKPARDAVLVATGKDLFGKWQCIKCHVVAGKLPSQDDPAMMAPDLAKVPERLRADWLGQWLMDPGRISPGTRMPTNFPKDPKENAYPEILGGDQQKQIDAVRAYLLSLGPAGQ